MHLTGPFEVPAGGLARSARQSVGAELTSANQHESSPTLVQGYRSPQYENAAIDLNRTLDVLFVDQLAEMLHGSWVMLRIAPTAPFAGLRNRESDCQPSYVHLHFAGQSSKGLGS